MSGPRSHPNPELLHLAGRGDIQTPSAYYRVMRILSRVTVPLLLRTRVFNRHHEPASGSVVYICNHQSFADPVLMGFGLARPMNYMARSSLFKAAAFGRFIVSLNAFPVERDAGGLSGLKEAMRRIQGGGRGAEAPDARKGQVVVYAEGTRTRDGTIGPFLPGVALLSKRAADWTVPVLIDGAFEAWPRTSPLPHAGYVVIQYDTPIPRSVARSMSAEDFVNMVRNRLIAVQTDVRRRVGRPALKYD